MYVKKLRLMYVTTFKISHVVSALSERTSSYAWLMDGSEARSEGAGIFFCPEVGRYNKDLCIDR